MLGLRLGELALSTEFMNDRIALASTDAAVAVLSAAIEAFYESDFCSNGLANAHQLRVFAVRTERATDLISKRQNNQRPIGEDNDPFRTTVLV